MDGWVTRGPSSRSHSRLLSLRVLMVLQVPKVWLARGVSLVYLGSVVREDSRACLGHR